MGEEAVEERITDTSAVIVLCDLYLCKANVVCVTLARNKVL